MTAPAGSLSRLAESAGGDFPHLLAARDLSERRLAELRGELDGFERDGDTSVVMLGSWGRRELTSQSDDDFLILVAGGERDRVRPRPDELHAVLGVPGATGVFGSTAFCDNLVSRIGLDQDDNANLTRRMLLMLESVPAVGDEPYRRCWERVLDGYLVDSVRDRHPPRFFLNDLIRYWRTICVDFVGKERGEPEKWGLRTLRAYDRWLALLDDADVRAHLAQLTREDTTRSDVFQEVRRLSVDIEQGLLALLFDTHPLRGLTREYAIF